jgi:hypothetical protein
MTLTVDPETAEKIRVALASGEPIEVRDAAGLLLERLILQGVIRPVDEPTGPLPPSVSWEELRRRAAERGGRSTAEILVVLAEAAKHR